MCTILRMSKGALLLMCLLPVLMCCRGKVDYNDPANVPEGTLRIFADRTRIDADGQDKVTFTVMFGSKDVSTDRNMNLIMTVDGKETSLKYGVNTFSSTTAATYSFTARYYSDGAYYTDNSVTVTASSVAQSVGKKDYYQKLWAMQFTAVSCTYCPLLTASLKSVTSSNPGRMVLTAFHVAFEESTMPDPMRLDGNEAFRNLVKHGDGLPLFAFNMVRSEKNIVSEEDLIRQQMQYVMTSFPAECGVAISTSYDRTDGEVTVTGRVTSNVEKEYRYHILLVEDGVSYPQMGAEDGYVHDNVVRSVLSGNTFGDKLNSGVAFKEGVEVCVTRTMAVDKDWNPDRMRVVFAALNSPDGGKTIVCNNMNECALGASVDYIYN